MTWKEVIKEMIPYGAIGAALPIVFLGVFFVGLYIFSGISMIG